MVMLQVPMREGRGAQALTSAFQPAAAQVEAERLPRVEMVAAW